MKKIIAGIGSRETPQHILELFVKCGEYLAKNDWFLRSGGANGADSAWEEGFKEGKGHIFLPSSNFNNRNVGKIHNLEYIVPNFSKESEILAFFHHPAYEKLSQFAKKLMMRNGNQVLGENLCEPATCVVCWTKNGAGGTRQAISIAKAYDIPVLDLGAYNANHKQVLWDFIKQF